MCLSYLRVMVFFYRDDSTFYRYQARSFKTREGS